MCQRQARHSSTQCKSSHVVLSHCMSRRQCVWQGGRNRGIGIALAPHPLVKLLQTQRNRRTSPECNGRCLARSAKDSSLQYWLESGVCRCCMTLLCTQGPFTKSGTPIASPKTICGTFSRAHNTANCIIIAQLPIENNSEQGQFAELPLKTIGKVQNLGIDYAIRSMHGPN